MSHGTGTRQRIETSMVQLMRRQGYGATSIKHLVEEAEAPIGSIYHFFPDGKRQVAAEALTSSGAAYIALVPTLMDPHPDLGEALRAFFAAAAEDLERSGWATMCPVVSVGAEVAEVEPALQSACADVVNGWIEQASAYFVSRGLEPPSARTLTLAALSALEGAFLIARITRSADVLRSSGEVLAATVQARTVTAT
jgi:AcrR family transcriptional regulator